jgi:hypothetical protein
MSRYLKMLPVMLYPYAYLIPLITLFATPAEGDNMANVYMFVFVYGIIIHIVVLGMAIYNAIVTANSSKPKRRLVVPTKPRSRIGQAIVSLQETMEDLGDMVTPKARRHGAA